MGIESVYKVRGVLHSELGKISMISKIHSKIILIELNEKQCENIKLDYNLTTTRETAIDCCVWGKRQRKRGKEKRSEEVLLTGNGNGDVFGTIFGSLAEPAHDLCSENAF